MTHTTSFRISHRTEIGTAVVLWIFKLTACSGWPVSTKLKAPLTDTQKTWVIAVPLYSKKKQLNTTTERTSKRPSRGPMLLCWDKVMTLKSRRFLSVFLIKYCLFYFIVFFISFPPSFYNFFCLFCFLFEKFSCVFSFLFFSCYMFAFAELATISCWLLVIALQTQLDWRNRNCSRCLSARESHTWR